MSRAKKRKMKAAKGSGEMPILRPNAAGIDIGATEIYVAVPPDRGPEPVRSFPTFTEDLHRLADWLKACGIETVAMESTGVYWIPLFQILEVPGQCAVLPECSRSANRCFRLSVVAIPPLGGTLASILSAGGSGLRAALPDAPSRHSDSDRRHTRSAHAQSAGSDEPTNPPCHQ